MDVIKSFVGICKKLHITVPYIKIENQMYKYYLFEEKYKIEIDKMNQIKDITTQNLIEFYDELNTINNNIIENNLNKFCEKNKCLELYKVSKDIYKLILENLKIPIPEEIEINEKDKIVNFIWGENIYITINQIDKQIYTNLKIKSKYSFDEINNLKLILEKYFDIYYLDKEEIKKNK